MLRTDDDLRQSMGQRAYEITVLYFAWENMVPLFAQALNIDPGD